MFKRLIMLCLLCLTYPVFGATYYVANNGDDANDGLSTKTPWQTIDKLNTVMFVDGDTISFKRGDIFRGALSPLKFPKGLTFNAYDRGDNPVIAGSVQITDWKSAGKGVFEADTSSLFLMSEHGIEHLFVNGELMTIARYPNVDSPLDKNWLRVGDSAGKDAFTDSVLADYNKSNNYWKGATLRIRNYSWTLKAMEVTGYSSGQGKITAKGLGTQLPEWGYFLDGKLEELDHPGEWFYDPDAKKVYLYPKDGKNPNDLLVEGSTYDIGISISTEENDTLIENLTFQHFTDIGVKLTGSSNVTVQNCTFKHNTTGLYSWNIENAKVLNNVFDYQLKIGMVLQAASGFDVKDSVAEYNQITNTGMYRGYGVRFDGVYQGLGISVFGKAQTVRKNYIDNTSHAGITLKDDGYHWIESNVISRSLQILNDGGAIVIGADGNTIKGNILVESLGNTDESNGCGSTTSDPCMHHPPYGMGIGANNNFKNNTIEGNVIANNTDMGIRLNSFKNTVVKDNIVYNNDPQIAVEDKNGPSSNNTIENNVLFSLHPEHVGLSLTNSTEHGTFNNNYFCNPYNEAVAIRDGEYYSLARWQAEFPKYDKQSLSCDLHFSLYKFKETSDNLLQDETFDEGVSGWRGAVEHDAGDSGLDGGSLKFTMSGQSAFAVHSNIPLEEGQFYRFTFSVIANDFGTLQMRLNDADTDNRAILEEIQVPVDTQRKEYEFFFQSSRTTSTGQVILLNDKEDAKNFWLDNTVFKKVRLLNSLPPTEYAKLIYNTTEEFQTTKLLKGTTYSDLLSGETIRSKVTLPPFGSKILIRAEKDDPRAPKAPNLTINVDGRDVTASWDTVNNATGYRLFYADYPAAAFNPDPIIEEIDMGEQTSISVRLPKGTGFFVALKAYNDAGMSDYSNVEFFMVD